MDTLTHSELRRMLTPRAGHFLSLYVPTHVGGVSGEEDAAGLRHVLDHAEKELAARGLRGPDARGVLAAARALPADKIFWKQRQRSLAVFIGPEMFRAFRLPYEVPEELTVGRRFRVTPLLRFLSGSSRSFYILALSQNRVRLILASEFSAHEVDVPDLDRSLQEALGEETVGLAEDAYAVATHGGGLGTARKQAGVLQSHSGRGGHAKQDVAHFFRLVDVALHPTLRGQKLPLVLAGVDHLLPIYREVSTYASLLAEGVAGNFDYSNAAEIRDAAWPIVRPHLDEERLRIVERYRRAGAKTTSRETGEVVLAAWGGRVEALFVDPQHAVYGNFDDETGEVSFPEISDRAENLVELSVSQTLLTSGKVYPLDEDQTEVDAPLCALLRY